MNQEKQAAINCTSVRQEELIEVSHKKNHEEISEEWSAANKKIDQLLEVFKASQANKVMEVFLYLNLIHQMQGILPLPLEGKRSWESSNEYVDSKNSF